MSALYSLLMSPWFAPLAGVLSVLMLIWLVAPLLSQFGFTWLSDPVNQIIVSAVVLLVYVGFIGFRWFRHRSRSKKLSRDLAGAEVSEEEKAADEEAAKLQEIFRNALDDLKTHAAGGKRKDYLYRLPWYIIIGPARVREDHRPGQFGTEVPPGREGRTAQDQGSRGNPLLRLVVQ